jgi:hypothetical protein
VQDAGGALRFYDELDISDDARPADGDHPHAADRPVAS